MATEEESSVETQDISLFPTAHLELPMTKTNITEEDHSEDVTFELSEKWVGDDSKNDFEYLKIELTVNVDDPRLKAIDIYTQFAGVRTIMIKHGPRDLWPTGQALYGFFPNRDEEQDRTIQPGESVVTRIEYPAEYSGATGLSAHSHVFEIDNASESVDADGNGHRLAFLELGMVKGRETGSRDTPGSPSGQEGQVIIVKLSKKKEFIAGGALQEASLVCHNPLYEVEWEFRDYHPIPFSAYTVYGYFSLDELGGGLEKKWLTGLVYRPSNLKVGKIVKRTAIKFGYNYVVRCMDQTSKEGWSYSSTTIKFEMLKYELGRWVLLVKDLSDVWHISQSSGFYWEDIVDYFISKEG